MSTCKIAVRTTNSYSKESIPQIIYLAIPDFKQVLPVMDKEGYPQLYTFIGSHDSIGVPADLLVYYEVTGV